MSLSSPHTSALTESLSQCGDKLKAYGRRTVAADGKLAFESVCTLKALAPLMNIQAYETARKTPDDEINDLIQRITSVCRTESHKVCENLGISKKSAREWGVTYYAGAIAKHISDRWERHGKECLEMDWAGALTKIAKPIFSSKGLPPVWENADIEVGLSATMLNAMTAWSDEFDIFSQFHKSKEDLSAELSDCLLDNALNNARALSEEFELTKHDEIALAQSFLKHGGSILRKLWRASNKLLIDQYQKASPEDRLILASKGSDLAPLKVQLNHQMTALMHLSKKTMNRAFAIQESLTDEQSPNCS